LNLEDGEQDHLGEGQNAVLFDIAFFTEGLCIDQIKRKEEERARSRNNETKRQGEGAGPLILAVTDLESSIKSSFEAFSEEDILSPVRPGTIGFIK
jgi:hypothetical protein